MWSTLRPMEFSTSAIADAVGGVRAIEHQAELLAAVSQLVGDLQEQADVLDVGDLEGQQAQDQVGHVQQRQGRVLEHRPAVDDDQVVRRPEPVDDAPDVLRR